MKKLIYLFLSLFLILSTLSFAGNKPKGNIHPNLKLYFAERFRLVTWDNAITLFNKANGANTFSRHRTNLGLNWYYDNNWEFAIKFTNEFRNYFTPQNREFDMNEIFVDNLYAKYNGSFGSITIGRQNIILGEGFVVFDASPLDGSRSIYFNALRGDINLSKTNTLTAFFAYQPQEDNILPVIHDQEKWLVEQPEYGFGFYLTSQFDKINLQSYYIYKKIDKKDGLVASNIHTPGARVSLPLTNQLSLTGEVALQFGDMGDADRMAVGGYFHLDYILPCKAEYKLSKVTFGSIYLSGDDPSTLDKNEGWDGVFARWPKWGESYIYTQIKEFGKVAYWSNYFSIYAGANFKITDAVTVDLKYYKMYAPQETYKTSFLSGNGSSRGDLITSKLIFKINKNFSGHIIWEHLEPGDFYFNSADSYNWSRVELMYSL